MNKVSIFCSLLIFSFVSSVNQGFSQNKPFLERTLTLALNDERLDAALRKISEQGGFTFSYASSTFDPNKKVTHSFVNKTVREILDELFHGTVEYKSRGKYIILTKAQVSTSKDTKTYSGYVVDEATGERLKDVAIYDPVTLSSTLTDSYGFFEIKVDKPPSDLKLVVNKRNYTDTLVVTPSRTGRLLTIQLKETSGKIATFADSVGSKIERFWKSKILLRQMKTMANVSDTLRRATQVSFVPFIGTNHALSGNVINDVSFNILGGYSLGIKKFELGGLFNVVRSDVSGGQIAGIFNAVGGEVKGGQVAGIFNANKGSVEGAQFAGIFNFNWTGTKYFGAAGIFNFTRKNSNAVQFAGITNLTIGEQKLPHFAGILNVSTGNANTQFAGIGNLTAGDFKNWQASGVFNFAARNTKGAQTSGVLNFTGKDLRGAQVAGVLNFAGKQVDGAQIAGVLNFSGKQIKGAQIAGVLNYATKVKGLQLGLINVSDSVGGVPIGLLSVVLKGYHKIEVSTDEIFYTNVAIRTGVRQFYNILTAGMNPNTTSDSTTHWVFGYGLGTAPRLSKKFFLNFDLTANQIVQGSRIESINLLNKFYIGADYQFARYMSLTFGATLNAYITDNTYDNYWTIFPDFQPEIISNRDYSNDLNMKMWIGGKVGLRFL